MRQGDTCDCKEGWAGINCNVCTSDKACDALMPGPESARRVCYQNGDVVEQNYQMCDVTNRKIRDLLDERVPQVTFTCNAEKKVCDFQCKSTRLKGASIANMSKFGFSKRNRSIALSILARQLPITTMIATAQVTNATTFNANVFLTGCCAERADLLTYRTF